MKNSNKIDRMDSDRRHEISQYMQKHLELINCSSELAKQAEIFSTVNVKTAAQPFFSEHDKMVKNAFLISKECPDEKSKIENISQEICNHNFDFLGTGEIPFGEKINWHYDYRACYEWPKDVNFLAMERGAFDILVGKYRDSEIKFPWDVSNLMWFSSLVSAFFLTDDPQYSDAVQNDLNDWFDSNPPIQGVNWFCPMNIAMRAINIIISLTALYPQFSKDFADKILQQLMMHGIVISAYLEIEKSSKRNNHYLANLVGLYYLGTFFQDTELGLHWLEFAEKELELESAYQFYPDGTTFEDSTSYHRLSVEMLLICAILGKDNQREFSGNFLQQLQKSLHFTCDILPAHNIVQQIGDNDNGRMIQFSGFSDIPATDHRHILALGGEFFDDEKLKQVSQGREVEALWFLGKTSRTSSIKLKPYFFNYRDGGYFGVKLENSHFLIRNGNISSYCMGGHAHEDQLSFTFSHNGIDFFVDPGSYSYSSDQKARNEFRSVAYHNTIQVNKSPMHYFDQESFEGLWWMVDQANAQTTNCSFNNGIFTFNGEIESFIKSDGYKVSRQITMNTAKSHIEISDTATQVQETKLNDIVFSRFLFGPEIKVKRVGYRKLLLLHRDQAVATMESLSEHTSFLIRQAWFSPEYGCQVPAWQLQICWDPKDEKNINTVISYS